MHPMLTEQVASAHFSDLLAEAGQRQLIRTARPPRCPDPRRGWWRRNRT